MEPILPPEGDAGVNFDWGMLPRCSVMALVDRKCPVFFLDSTKLCTVVYEMLCSFTVWFDIILKRNKCAFCGILKNGRNKCT